MGEELDAAVYGLHRAAVHEVGGLVFVWLAAERDPFEPARGELEVALAHQGLLRAKVAQRVDYRVRANWKLVWQNNRECRHRHAGHPE